MGGHHVSPKAKFPLDHVMHFNQNVTLPENSFYAGINLQDIPYGESDDLRGVRSQRWSTPGHSARLLL